MQQDWNTPSNLYGAHAAPLAASESIKYPFRQKPTERSEVIISGYAVGRITWKPASWKCLSVVRAARISNSSITTKLEQSVKEYP